MRKWIQKRGEQRKGEKWFNREERRSDERFFNNCDPYKNRSQPAWHYSFKLTRYIYSIYLSYAQPMGGTTWLAGFRLTCILLINCYLMGLKEDTTLQVHITFLKGVWRQKWNFCAFVSWLATRPVQPVHKLSFCSHCNKVAPILLLHNLPSFIIHIGLASPKMLIHIQFHGSESTQNGLNLAMVRQAEVQSHDRLDKMNGLQNSLVCQALLAFSASSSFMPHHTLKEYWLGDTHSHCQFSNSDIFSCVSPWKHGFCVLFIKPDKH